mmetsp:Transcript_17406/g.25745  ORF Transcript_17406/g.25745 Transcript_17406/m.25745 type:complete len:244 (-) Transcript_17406:96-827(-)
MRPTNHKATTRVQVINGLFVQELFGNNGLDDMLHKVRCNLLVGNILRVLRRDDNGVNALGDRNSVLQFVLARDLGLSIGTDPCAGSILADLRQLGSEGRGKIVRQRHERFRLVRGVSKHDTLISSTNVFHARSINRLGNIRRLFLDSDNNIASLVVKALSGIIVSNVLDGIANDLFVVDRGGSCDFSKNHNHARLAACFACNTRRRVSSDASIEDGVRDLIAELIRMSLVNGLGSEQKGRHVA